MIKNEELMTIKTLHKTGVSNRHIAKQLKISRNTVVKYVNRDGPPNYNRQKPYRSILDEHREYLLTFMQTATQGETRLIPCFPSFLRERNRNSA